MYRVLLLMLSVCFLACTEQDKTQNRSVLSENQMIDALVKVHLLESATQLNLLDGITSDSLAIGNYYQGLFADESFSLHDFKTSFVAYSKDPNTMEVLLDSVLTRIQMME